MLCVCIIILFLVVVIVVVCFVLSFLYVEHACLYFSVFIPHPDITVMADWALKIIIYLVFVFHFNFLHAFIVPERVAKYTPTHYISYHRVHLVD